MYVPSHFRPEGVGEIVTFIHTVPFAILVSSEVGRPVASHIPIDIAEGPDGAVVISGHLARSNPQWRTFSRETEQLLIFPGPHAYISPSWYRSAGVPTWNYQAVHAYGVATVIDDRGELRELLERLIHRHEHADESSSGYLLSELPPDQLDSMMNAIVGFHLRVSRFDASWKLSQNRSAEERARIAAELRSRPDADSHAIASAMSTTKP